MNEKYLLYAGILAPLFIMMLLWLGMGTNQQKIPETTVATGTSTNYNESSPQKTTMDTATYTHALITTNKGTIEFEFDQTKKLTVNNFTTLAKEAFYDGIRFHRVIQGFMIQTGDPLSKDETKKSVWGTGGPGYRFNDELSGTEQYMTGTVAMANAGPNTNGSQFFIVTAQPGVPLPPSYTVFGKVTKGIDVALAIEKVATSQSDQPLEDIIIEKVELR